MVRFLFWALIIYLVWKLYQSFTRQSPRRSQKGNPAPPAGSFDHVEDAEFEDLTPKQKDQSEER